MSYNVIEPEDLVNYVNRASPDELEEFIREITPAIEMLESEDFFGTEGFEKRFG